MKIDMELKPGDVVLLKVLACVLILFFMARFLIFPGMEKHPTHGRCDRRRCVSTTA